MKRDAYKVEEKWNDWKNRHFESINGIRKEDHAILIEFLKDMELGLNTPRGRKGKRGEGTLLNLAAHNVFFLEKFNKPLNKLTKQDLHKLEDDVSKGKIKKKSGGTFKQFGNYIKDFKVLWHWMLRTNKVTENITEDITSKTDKPTWVFLTEEQIKQFFNKLDYDYRALCWLFYDSGMRVTEANSVQVLHFSDDFSQLTIPDEVSKTFGRTINLKLCTQLIKDYVREKGLKPEDYLVQKDLWAMNKYLKENCGKTFGKEKVSNSKAGGLYGNFTLYDIRHNSACFWLNRYPTQNSLMYRFGWRKADKIEYYSDFLGVKDQITDEDMVLAEDRGKLQRLEKENEEVKKRLKQMEKMLNQVVNKKDKKEVSAG